MNLQRCLLKTDKKNIFLIEFNGDVEEIKHLN